MKKYHHRDPLTLPPSTGDELIELLAWRLKISDQKHLIRAASLDPVPLKIHGGDHAREALLQLIHPRSAALLDLLLRSCPEGKSSRIRGVMLHSGVNQSTTTHLLEVAMRSMREAINSSFEERVARRNQWAKVADEGKWPWNDSVGGYKAHRTCDQPRRS